jgi:DNA topoisomerase IB
MVMFLLVASPGTPKTVVRRDAFCYTGFIVQGAGVPDSVADAGLVRVDPFAPGIRRTRGDAGFVYDDPDGRRIDDAETLDRIRHLVIPPAWRDVWVSPNPLAHIQATGFDKAGRKQYRYHPAWRDLRDHQKFDEVTSFGEQLPALRQQVELDLGGDGLSRTRVLGCAVRLLDLGSFRIGSDRYAVADDTHGLTTMLTGAVRLEGGRITFDYVGKEHKHRVQHVCDGAAGSVVAALLRLRAPGQRLFAFQDHGRWLDLHAGDVNHYLREASGMSASAKEFRTWNATVLGASALAGTESPRSKRALARAEKLASTVVAAYLGNTPTIARRSYVDPRVFDRYGSGWTIQPELAEMGIGLEARPPATRRPVEVAVLDLIQGRWDSERLRALSG